MVHTKVQVTTLSLELLDKIWKDWNRRTKSGLGFYTSGYQNISRSLCRCQNFEEWLWKNGFSVVQKDSKRYLQFIGDDKRLTLFLLRYGI